MECVPDLVVVVVRAGPNLRLGSSADNAVRHVEALAMVGPRKPSNIYGKQRSGKRARTAHLLSLV